MDHTAARSIDNLEALWRSLVELCDGLDEDEWKRPTGCPGWSVQDNVSHLIDYEARALGRPAPESEVAAGPHLKNALGESNEVGVELRRRRPGAAVLEELREVTAARSAQLRSLADEDLSAEVETPAGPRTVTDMLRLRVMDTWAHEQDIRRALARPGHEHGPAAEEGVTYFAGFLPIVVAKRAGAPDGSLVVFDIGDVHRAAIEVDGGRGRAVDREVADGAWTVRLRMPATTFAALVGGRSDVPDDVHVDGDQELGTRIVDVLGFMP